MAHANAPQDQAELADRAARAELEEGRAGLVRLALAAIAAGVATGLVGALFRLTLAQGEHWRLALAAWAHGFGPAGILVTVTVVAACAALARALVRLAPEAGGSGVQRVEAVMRHELPPARLRVLPVKFVGGALALGSGMALGREGPTVQIGATLGARIAAWGGLSDSDARVLEAAAGGAGLGVAFSAPLGGAMFTFEEVRRAFTVRLAVATLLAVSAAAGAAYLLMGARPDFVVRPPPVPGWSSVAPVLLLGALLGALGVLYNRTIIVLLDWAARWWQRLPEVKAAAIGAVVGALLFIDPGWVGGGEVLNQRMLDGAVPWTAMLALLVMRWVLGPLCFTAGVPGGVFAPLLMVGTAVGLLVAMAFNALVPALAVDPATCALIGMAAFFAGVVRAPLTGVALILEMSATTTALMPMLGAVAMAVAVATVLRGMPIYDVLRVRMLRTATTGGTATGSEPRG